MATAPAPMFRLVLVGSSVTLASPLLPEPETYALFLASIGVMGAFARRRSVKA